MRTFFGTDGIRGKAGEKITVDLALALGKAIALQVEGEGGHPLLVIGADSRISGPMLAEALAAGAASRGMNVIHLGICPTPAVAMLTKNLGASRGVMVSASHNPVDDNGLKIFGPLGFKLADSEEAQLEIMLEKALHGSKEGLRLGTAMGSIRHQPEQVDHYVEAIRQHFPKNMMAKSIGMDTAHGAACVTAKAVFKGCAHDIHFLSDNPDGHSINVNCGSTDLGQLQSLVKDRRLDIGFAFDGDADRLLVVDSKGDPVDGDLLMYLMAIWLKSKNLLSKNLLVTTQMSNLGLDEALGKAGIAVMRTEVCDRYVLEKMRAEGAVLGGEQSGHLIYLNAGSTGDGLLSTVLILAALADGISVELARKELNLKQQKLSNRELLEPIKLADYPQLIAFQEERNKALFPRARFYIRPSGTEPKMRLLVEADTVEEIESLTQEGWMEIQKSLGAKLTS